MRILIKNIKSLGQILPKETKWLKGQEMQQWEQIENAFLLIEGERIADFGPMEKLDSEMKVEEEIDASGRYVLPAFVDSHTHLVFAKSREEEFVDKIKGKSYAEIAAKGGGILNSARVLQETSEDKLFQDALLRARQIMRQGTGTVEIKSGYGLTLESELKMLRVAKRLAKETPLTVKTTFLGAHAIPKDQKREDYLKLVTEEMLPAVAEEKLAEYCDVFCEEGFFTEAETEMVLTKAADYGLKAKIHANQLHRSGGVQVGAKIGAISVDHLETIAEPEIEALKGTKTMATLLPAAAFFLRMGFPPARDLINAGLPVALATDYNPGSAPMGKMPLILSLACIQMRMTPEEAWNAATINGAYALELSHEVGSITKGKLANLLITHKIPSLAYIPYAFGEDHIHQVILKGKIVATNSLY